MPELSELSSLEASLPAGRVRRLATSRWRGTSPFLLGAGVAAFAVSQGLNASTGYRAERLPSASGIGEALAYVFLLAGALLLPTRPLTRASRQRLMVDAMMIMVAIVTFMWYFVLGPQLVNASASPGVEVGRVGYSALDLGLLAGLLFLLVHVRDAMARPIVPLLAGAIALIVASDVTQACLQLYGSFVPLLVPAVGRNLGFALIGVTLVSMRVTRRGVHLPDGTGHPLPTVWRYLLPYALVPAVVALMVYAAQARHHGRLEPVLYICGAALIELVFVHQFLAYRELIAFSSRSARLESLAAADPITGMPNHRTIVGALDSEIDRSRRYGKHCSVLFFDLDRFKQLNDSFGHRAGDAALREFASTVRVALRASDILGRWGGEEFVALLPETDVEMALAVAERVRVAVESYRFHSIGGGRLTCSIGLACFPDHARDRDSLIDMADRAMYAAKRAGRNQVQLWKEGLLEGTRRVG